MSPKYKLEKYFPLETFEKNIKSTGKFRKKVYINSWKTNT
jgi:hypothetical protein